MSRAKPTLQEKRDEKSRLLRAYRATHRQLWSELCEREPRMMGFRRFVRGAATPADLLVGLADSWVRSADSEVRYAALRQIDRQANRMARFSGRAALDDPLPPALNVYLASRQMLGVR